jgi:hypothetical protein
MDGNAKTENDRLDRIGLNAKPQGRQDAKTVLAMPTLAMPTLVVLVLLTGSME